MHLILQHIKQKMSNSSLSKWFFYLLLFTLPFGTKKIFFTEHSFFFGHHIFYHSFYLYLTDLIFICLILFWLWESRGRLIKRFDETYYFLAAFWLILATSLIVSRETTLSLYGFIKITQYLLLFVYIRENTAVSRETIRIFWLILATFSLQSVIAILQYLKQSSLGLRLLGEEWIRPGLKGVAQFVSRETISPFFTRYFANLSPISDDPMLHIRAYGTLPHPNVLAGLLFVGIVMNIYLLYRGARRGILVISLLLLTTGLVLTFSRLVWAITAISILVWLVRVSVKRYMPDRLVSTLLVLLVSLALNLLLFGGAIKDRMLDKGNSTEYFEQDSITERKTFNTAALRMIKDKPLFGVGLRNYVLEMDNYTETRLVPWLRQPVHNIYLLIAAETGIAALLLFLLFIWSIVRRQTNFTLLIIFSGLLMIGFFDHYLWTIQQGSLMFWIMLGLLAANKNTASAA